MDTDAPCKLEIVTTPPLLGPEEPARNMDIEVDLRLAARVRRTDSPQDRVRIVVGLESDGSR